MNYYFEHCCSLIPEEDVLGVDSKIPSWRIKWNLWWSNLFLPSYENEKVRSFYNSSYAIKMERLRQHRFHTTVIHPFSQFRSCWEYFFLVIATSNMILFYVCSSAASTEVPLYCYFLLVVFECILILDMMIVARTGYVDKDNHRIVLDCQRILYHFCSTRIFLHMMSALPLTSVMFARYGLNINCILCKANKFVFCLQILDIFRMFRIFEAVIYLNNYQGPIIKKVLVSCICICITGLVLQLKLATLYFATVFMIASGLGKFDRRSYASILLAFKHSGQQVGQYHLHIYPSNWGLVCLELSRIITAMNVYNLISGKDAYYVDKLALLFTYAFSYFIYVWIMILTYTCYDQIFYKEERIIISRDRTLNILKVNQLPNCLVAKVNDFYAFKTAQINLTKTMNHLYLSLPKSLKQEENIANYARFLLRVPSFAQWPLSMIRDLVMMLQEDIFLDLDIVAEAGVQGEGLFIVDRGVLAVYSSEKKEIGHLIDGDYFGEISLVTDKEIRLSSIVAVTPCMVLFLNKTAFRMYMRSHTTRFFEMKTKLRNAFFTK